MSIVETHVKPLPERKALGRGLAALLGNQELATSNSQAVQKTESPTLAIAPSLPESKYAVVEAPIESVQPNPDQPRKHFNTAKLEELSLSLKEHGVVQPIVVRRMPDNKFQIIAGERRWRASKLAGLTQIPVIVRDQKLATLDNDLASLVENIQREDLSPIELAVAYERLLRLHGFTQDTLAQKLGLSRVAVANTLRLLRLPDSVKEMISAKTISEGHSRALLALPSEQQILQMAQQIVQEGLTVREVENLVRQISNPSAVVKTNALSGTDAEPAARSPELAALEDELRKVLGTKVVLRGNPIRGTVEIYYTGRDSLNRIVHQLRSSQQ